MNLLNCTIILSETEIKLINCVNLYNRNEHVTVNKPIS